MTHRLGLATCAFALATCSLLGAARADGNALGLATDGILVPKMSQAQCEAKAKSALDGIAHTSLHSGNAAWIAQQAGAVIQIECFQARGLDLAYLTIAYHGDGGNLDSVRTRLISAMKSK